MYVVDLPTFLLSTNKPHLIVLHIHEHDRLYGSISKWTWLSSLCAYSNILSLSTASTRLQRQAGTLSQGTSSRVCRRCMLRLVRYVSSSLYILPITSLTRPELSFTSLRKPWPFTSSRMGFYPPGVSSSSRHYSHLRLLLQGTTNTGGIQVCSNACT